MSDYQKTSAVQDMNVFIFTGNIGKVSDLKYFQSGDAVLNFSVAQSNDYKDKDGKVIERTTWYNCAVYGKHAEGLNEIIRKWKSVVVNGEVQPARAYTDGKGQPAASNEVRVNQVKVKEWKKDQEQTSEADPFADVAAANGATTTPIPTGNW